jgi:hypothetical protein
LEHEVGAAGFHVTPYERTPLLMRVSDVETEVLSIEIDRTLDIGDTQAWDELSQCQLGLREAYPAI